MRVVRREWTVWLVAVLASLSGATPLRAQASPDSLIPRRLLTALFGAIGWADPSSFDLRVGQAAGGLPASAIPPGAEVMGSLVFEELAVTVVVVPMSAVDAIALVRSRLASDGWTPAPPPKPREPEGRGFVNRDDEQADIANLFCRGDATVRVVASAQLPQRSQLALLHQMHQQYSACTGDPKRQTPWADLPVPALYPPPGARTQGTSSGGGGDSWESSARIVSAMTADDLLAHYGAQLETAGWVARSRAASPVMGSQLWATKDGLGQTVFGLLTVAAPVDAAPRILAFRVFR